ncbi:protein phosphatase 2C domain-containing protein [Kitasatospora sp. NPDC001660]
MSQQGAPAQPHRSDDGWWDTVYDGPAGTLPDTPGADPGEGSVDDWFDTAAGLVAPQRTGEQARTEAAAATVAATAPGAERDSFDDWFDTALGVIGQQGPSTETHRFPAPEFRTGPVSPGKPDAPEPVAVAEPEPTADVAPAPESARTPDPDPDPDPEPEAVHASPSEPQPDRVPEPTAVAGARIEPEAVRVPEPEPDHAPDHAPEPESEARPAAAADPRREPEPAGTSAPEPAASPRPVVRSPLAGAADAVPHVGARPPTYGPEPTAVPEADPGALGNVVPDTVLEGAQYGSAIVRAVSVRGDSARYRGEPRRDALLVTRFGDGPDGLLLAVLGGFDRSGPAADEAADEAVPPEVVSTATGEACRQLAAAVGRSRAGLAADLRDAARDRLRYGLQRLATGAAAPLRALAPRGEDGPSPASLHCLMVSLDPAAGYRAAFGVGPGGLYLLRSGHWIDAYAAQLLHHPDGAPPVPDGPVPQPRAFRFRLVPATPGDILLLCTPGLAGPIADEPAVAHFLSSHWAHPHPPGTVDFLRQVQVRAKGYADDRTAAAVWTD